MSACVLVKSSSACQVPLRCVEFMGPHVCDLDLGAVVLFFRSFLLGWWELEVLWV